MDKTQQIEITIKNSVVIPTDEYADLLSARTRLDVLCDIVVAQKYLINKEEILLIARGAPTNSKHLDTTITPENPGETDHE